MRVAKPVAAPAGVRVWRLELDLLRGRLDELLPGLPVAERERCLQYRLPGDRLRFALSRLVLRHLLAQHLQCEPQALRIEADVHGKPHLVDGGGLHFNLSHAAQYALIALSTAGPVGVDIERVRNQPSADLQGSLTPEERAYCASRARARLAAFFRIWCGKEAVLKALGVGIARHLDSVSVIPATRGGYAVTTRMPGWSAQAWQLPAPYGYAAALAVSEPVAAVLGQETEMATESG
jgi:4'-phosphopantetheinyl transferase